MHAGQVASAVSVCWERGEGAGMAEGDLRGVVAVRQGSFRCGAFT